MILHCTIGHITNYMSLLLAKFVVRVKLSHRKVQCRYSQVLQNLQFPDQLDDWQVLNSDLFSLHSVSNGRLSHLTGNVSLYFQRFQSNICNIFRHSLLLMQQLQVEFQNRTCQKKIRYIDPTIYCKSYTPVRR